MKPTFPQQFGQKYPRITGHRMSQATQDCGIVVEKERDMQKGGLVIQG